MGELFLYIVTGVLVLFCVVGLYLLFAPPLSPEAEAQLARMESHGEMPTFDLRVTPAVQQALGPSSLALYLLASSKRAYRRVRMGAWAEKAALHNQCLLECLRMAGPYCQTNPNKMVVLLAPLLDSSQQAGPRRGRMVSRCSSAYLRQQCLGACRCDKSGEICPTGYHLQIEELPPDEQADSLPPTVASMERRRTAMRAVAMRQRDYRGYQLLWPARPMELRTGRSSSFAGPVPTRAASHQDFLPSWPSADQEESD